jgi:acyl-ACP thioesterase
MNNRKRVETIIECLNEELKQTEKTIAELEEKKEMAIGEPVQFLESVLNSVFSQS